MLTHPDPDYLGRPAIGRAYRETLQAIAERDDVWVALPREVAEWWRRRAGEPGGRADALAQWTGTTLSCEWSGHE
jgi:hypothetical protein